MTKYLLKLLDRFFGNYIYNRFIPLKVEEEILSCVYSFIQLFFVWHHNWVGCHLNWDDFFNLAWTESINEKGTERYAHNRLEDVLVYI